MRTRYSLPYSITASLLSTASAIFFLSSPAHAQMMGEPKASGETTAPADHTRLAAAVILSRHGNRSLLKDNATLERETSNTWPTWTVPPGHLTDRGRKQMVSMGNYYRERFRRDGLLTGNDAEDVKHAYFHTNVIQRTIQSGCGLAEGLFPSTTTTVHYLAPGKKDLLFYGSQPDAGVADAALKGRIGNDVPALALTMKPQIDLVEKSLAKPGLFARTMSSISLASTMADNYMCEYCDGMPMQQVGFGRINESDLQEMLKILALDFDLRCRTPYLARYTMSNMVGHIVATLERGASGKPVSGAFGDDDDRLAVIGGHDSTVSSVAGLLRLDWVLPDTGRNLCPPGGGLVFELRRDDTAMYFVRVYYCAPTLHQLRDDVKFTLQNPPSVAPIFVPGSSQGGPWFDSPLEDFVANAKQAIDPKLVVPVDDGQ